MFIAAGYYITQEKSLNIACPLILWAVYLLYDVFRKDKQEDFSAVSNIFNCLNVSVLTVFSWLIFSSEKTNIGILLLFTAAVYTIFTAVSIMRSSSRTSGYVHSMLLCVMAASYFLSSGVFMPVTFSIEAALLTLAAKYYRLNYIASRALAYFSAALAALLFTPDIIFTAEIEKYTPILNKRLAGMAVYTAALFTGAKLLQNSCEKPFIVKHYILKAGWITSIALYIIFELNDYITFAAGAEAEKLQYFAKACAFAVIGFNYAGVMRFQAEKSSIETFNFISRCAYWLSALSLCAFSFNYPLIESFTPVINIRTAGYIFAIAASVIFARASKLDLYKYAAAVLGFLYISAETLDFSERYGVSSYLLSLMWIIYAGIITGAGIFADKSYLKNTGIWISIIAVLKIVFIDTAGIDMIYRLILFAALGIVLMIVSFYYNKNKRIY